MSSAIDICNLALSMIGDEATVSSISPPEGSAQARHCARFYPIARRAIIETHTWSFSTRRESLAELADAAPDSWAFAYSLPSQCIKPFKVLFPEATSDQDSQAFTVESLSSGLRVLYTNVEDATLVYAVDVTDTTKYSPLFVVALARLLAYFLAGPIIKGTDGMTVALKQWDIFRKVELPAATASDSVSHQTSTYDDFTPSSVAARA